MFIFQLPATSRFRSGMYSLRESTAPQGGEVAAATPRVYLRSKSHWHDHTGTGAGQPTGNRSHERRIFQP
jgi:hypothetical protein